MTALAEGCQWEVAKGETCGAPADGGEVTLRDPNVKISARIKVCLAHKAEHNRKAAQLRVKH